MIIHDNITSHLIAMVKNESDIIGKFIDHHSKIFDNITIVDNGSTDGTFEILKTFPSIELIRDDSHFSEKVPIMKREIERSQSDVIFPMDADELLIICKDGDFITDPEQIKKEIQNIDLNYEVFATGDIYEYIPDTKNIYRRRTWGNKKCFIKRDTFLDTCPGYHNPKSVNGLKCKTDFMYLHKHFRDFDRWMASSKRKMNARIGEDWDNLEKLKDYEGSSNHIAKELYRYFTEGVYHDLHPEDDDVNINI